MHIETRPRADTTNLAARTGLGKGTLLTRHGGAVSRREMFDAGTPFLPGFAPAPTFTF